MGLGFGFYRRGEHAHTKLKERSLLFPFFLLVDLSREIMRCSGKEWISVVFGDTLLPRHLLHLLETEGLGTEQIKRDDKVLHESPSSGIMSFSTIEYVVDWCIFKVEPDSWCESFGMI